MNEMLKAVIMIAKVMDIVEVVPIKEGDVVVCYQYKINTDAKTDEELGEAFRLIVEDVLSKEGE